MLVFVCAPAAPFQQPVFLSAVNLILSLVVTAALVWWLTGFDKTYAGESKRGHHFSRALRTVLVVFLLGVLLWAATGGVGAAGVPLLLIIPVSIALLLRSSLSEIFAGGFFRLLDPAAHDTRELDLKLAQRHRDNLAWLIHHGQREQAVKLCEELKRSGELDESTLNSTLEFLGVKQDRPALERPLHEADRLRAAGNISEAEARLKILLQKNPADTSAALALMRLYAEDLRQPGRAHELLRALEKQPSVPRSTIEFARRSIDDWAKPKKVSTPNAAPPPATLEELLAQKAFGSAIELIGQRIAQEPQNFSLRLQLAEIHAVHCADVRRAGRILAQAQAELRLTEVESALVSARLKEWRAAGLPRK